LSLTREREVFWSLSLSAATSKFDANSTCLSHYRNQYCDGLRGALVIYDPNDPNKDLYDVDDGV